MANGLSVRLTTALLVLPAGPSSLLPIPLPGGVWKSGVRLSGPISDPRALLAVVRGVPVAASGALALVVVHCVSAGPSSPCRGRVVDPLRCIMPFPSGVCTRPCFCEPRGAPGASRALTPKVPASELAVAFPVPRRASCVLRVAARFVFLHARDPFEKKKGGREGEKLRLRGSYVG